MKTLFLVLLALAGCARQKEVYQYNWNGQTVRCPEGRIYPCGVAIENCDDGNSYYCLHDVAERRASDVLRVIAVEK